MMKRGEPNRQANLWVARIIPVVLLGIIGYASWVATKRVCVDYLINPDPSTLVQPRPGAAIAILVIYYLLLLALLICYARLIYTIVANPGFLPRGPGWRAQQEQEKTSRKHHSKRRHRRKDLDEKDSVSSSNHDGQRVHDRSTNLGDQHPRVEDFWRKDVFVCNYDGRPPWCSTCMNWKTDRAHHCSEVNRCVRKMDHFCPWVGGIVSETSIKFFLQFLFYTMLFTTHALVFSAYFFAERQRKTNYLDVHWILLLAFAALFFFFSVGMFISSAQLALLNCSTIENFSRTSKVWYMAIYLSRPDAAHSMVQAAGKPALRTISYPRPPEEAAMFQDSRFHKVSGATPQPPTPSNGPLAVTMPPSTLSTTPSRTFAILELARGANPWAINPLTNWREVMGYKIFEWFLPIKHSPCAHHSDPESMYRLGPAVSDARRAAGIHDFSGDEHERKKRRRRRKSSRAADESQSGNEKRRKRREKG